MDALVQDIRYGLRLLTKSPGFTAAAVVTLALGIGANAAIFSLANALLWKGVPGVDMDGLAAVYTEFGEGPSVSSYMDYVDFRDQSDAFAGLAAFKPRLVDLAGGGLTERVEGMMVSANYFSVLGVRPAAGRFFVPEEDSVPGGHAVAVISHALWQNRLGGDPDVVGRDLAVNGRNFTVVGVAPPGFHGTRLVDRPQVFVPVMMQPHLMPAYGNLLANRGWGGIFIVGRVAPGVSLARAEANLAAIGERLAADYPATNAGREYSVAVLAEATLGPGMRGQAERLSALLMGVVVLVLLVACVNVANLLLARAERRRREIGVRQAIGAGRGRLVRQLLAESLLLGLAGGALGLLLAAWAAEGLGALPMPLHVDPGLDGRVLAFTALVAVATSMVFGLAPALGALRVEVSGALKHDGGDARARRFRLSHLLVVAQVALSLFLLVAAGLFTRTLAALVRTDPGFSTERTLVATLDPRLQGYEPAAILPFYDRLLERVAAVPGVERASLVSALPGPMNDDVSSITVEGYRTPDGSPTYLGFGVVGLDYFRALEIPIVAGRDFTVADRAEGSRTIMVNEAAARLVRGLTGRDVVGQRLSPEGPDGPFFEVVGVAADSRLGGPREEAFPFVYLFHPQVATLGAADSMTLLVRTAEDPVQWVEELRAAVASIDPNLPLVDVGTLEGHLSGLLSQERLTTTLLGLSALLALALAAIGLYGVIAYSVSQRTRELGVRMALGARHADLLALVLTRGMMLALAGLAVGLAGAFGTTRLLEGFLYGTSRADPFTFVLVSGLLLAVALVASYLPARAATRVDPLRALRHE